VKIEVVNVPASHHGLKQMRLSGLGSVVLLAGPNGAGKSRLLRLVSQSGAACLSQEERVAANAEIANLTSSLEVRLKQVEAAVERGDPADSTQMVNLRSPIVHWENARKNQQDRLDADAVLERDSSVKPVVVSYDVERISLRDWKDFPQREVLQFAQNIATEFSVRIVPDAGLSAVRALINRYVYAAHANSPECHELQAEIERLQGLIREFIGAELAWDLDGDPTLFGRPVASAGLSAGQLVLLQVALSLFFQRGDREDLVLLMDEPENHLHPLAVLTMIDEVRKKCPHAQLWIATHSLHILAHFNPADIWFVRDGEAEHAGSTSVEVLQSLVGGDRGVEELLEFIALPAKNALLSFATQCLLPPGVVDTNVGDPQTSQIAHVIADLSRNGGCLRVLDFGIGKARLLTELIGFVDCADGRFGDVLDYYGVDLFSTDENMALCKQRLAEAYGEDSSRYFTSMTQLADALNEASFDVVVMCNTLHEIPPEEWLLYFGPAGKISRLLRDSGYLLVVEDQFFPTGERAHKYGYLVLDAPELRLLTATTNEDVAFRSFDSHIPKYTGRLRAHLVPSQAVRRVSSDSRRRALVRLRERSLAVANELAGEQFNGGRARRYAFWCHQHVNASLALQALYGVQDEYSERSLADQPA
jgi:energy-coupling factor transporter ATP-binding protein EcfA2